MKKIAIITINHGNNYGNKLQNYAMQEIYKKLDLDVETIAFSPTIDTSKFVVSKNLIKRIYNKINNKFQKIRYKDVTRRRIENFDKFNKFIKFSKIYTEENYEEINGLYDYYSVGSDQVWNPCFHDFSQLYLLKNIESQNKFSYAASFGIDNLPSNYIEMFRSNLSDFKYISCREKSGVTIVKDVLNLNAVEVLDPTFLLTRKDWEKVIEEPKELKTNEYILLYFLGSIDKVDLKCIKKYAKKKKLKIIDIMDMNKEYYTYNPSQFLGLIKNASLVLTDSFHATLFSILFNKEFLVYKRQGITVDMSTRIKNLLDEFNYSNNIYTGDFDNIKRIDEKEIERKLNALKEKSINYIMKCIGEN